MEKANISLLFNGTQTNRNDNYLKCYANIDNEISLVICEDQCPDIGISLDIPTAIKLSKVLRSEISKIKD